MFLVYVSAVLFMVAFNTFARETFRELFNRPSTWMLFISVPLVACGGVGLILWITGFIRDVRASGFRGAFTASPREPQPWTGARVGRLVVRLMGVLVLLGSLLCFWKSYERFESARILASEADEIDLALGTGRWGRDPGEGRKLVELGRADAVDQRRKAWTWMSGGVGLIIAGGTLMLLPLLRRKQPTNDVAGEHHT